MANDRERESSIHSSEPWMASWNSLENALERLKQNKRVEIENLINGIFGWGRDMRQKTKTEFGDRDALVFLSSTYPNVHLLVSWGGFASTTVKEFLPPNPVSEQVQESPQDSPYGMLGKYIGTTSYISDKRSAASYNRPASHDNIGTDVSYTVRYVKEKHAEAPHSEFTVRFHKDKSEKFLRWNGDVRKYALGDPLLLGEKTLQLLEGAIPIGRFSRGKIIPFDSPTAVRGQ